MGWGLLLSDETFPSPNFNRAQCLIPPELSPHCKKGENILGQKQKFVTVLFSWGGQLVPSPTEKGNLRLRLFPYPHLCRQRIEQNQSLERELPIPIPPPLLTYPSLPCLFGREMDGGGGKYIGREKFYSGKCEMGAAENRVRETGQW